MGEKNPREVALPRKGRRRSAGRNSARPMEFRGFRSAGRPYSASVGHQPLAPCATWQTTTVGGASARTASSLSPSKTLSPHFKGNGLAGGKCGPIGELKAAAGIASMTLTPAACRKAARGQAFILAVAAYRGAISAQLSKPPAWPLDQAARRAALAGGRIRGEDVGFAVLASLRRRQP